MNWLKQIFPSDAVPTGMAILALAVVLGLALGAIKWRGFRLGISGVLFAALVLGQLGFKIQGNVLEFLSDFSLILFVYAIGLQVGPGFLASLKAEGARLNLLALATIGVGAAMTAVVIYLAHSPDRAGAAVGLYSGAFTTTPGLAAGQDALRQARSQSANLGITNLGYAVSYPFGIVGPMLVVLALKYIFRIDMAKERAALLALDHERRPPLEVMSIEVTNPAHAGKALRDHPLLKGKGVVLTRLLRDKSVIAPTADTRLEIGDIFRATGSHAQLNDLVAAIGRESPTQFTDDHGDIKRADLVVTRTQVLRKTLRELDFTSRVGVTIARINRTGVELAARAGFKFHFGDQVTAVGPTQGLKAVAEELGNSPDLLNRPQLIPIFVGMVLGVLVGSIPLRIPGLHIPMRIGMAGGPMLVAIALSQFGNIGAVVWYMPAAAKQLFRDFGLAVFLACVGLKAGNHFLDRAISTQGLIFVAWGAAVTVLPSLIVGCVARIWCKLDFMTLAGWVAGTMTSTPALLMTEDMGLGADAAATAYAAVAPLALLGPIVCVQILVAWLV